MGNRCPGAPSPASVQEEPQGALPAQGGSVTSRWAPRRGHLARCIASLLLLPGVKAEKRWRRTWDKKTAHYPKPISNVLRTLRESSTQSATQKLGKSTQSALERPQHCMSKRSCAEYKARCTKSATPHRSPRIVVLRPLSYGILRRSGDVTGRQRRYEQLHGIALAQGGALK